MARISGPSPSADRDGVTVEKTAGGARRRALLLSAAAMLALAIAVVLASVPGAPPDEPRSASEGGTAALGGDGDARAPDASVARLGAQAPAGLPPAHATDTGASGGRAEARPMSDEALLAALRRAERRGTIEVGDPDEPRGLAALPPPGTDPPKPGIIVPEDFALPPGYVRHYQTTDDGRQLPAVLMFHPDTAPRGADGEPIAIVPPELAPPGLPIAVLDVPEPQVELLEPPGGKRVRQPPAR